MKQIVLSLAAALMLAACNPGTQDSPPLDVPAPPPVDAAETMSDPGFARNDYRDTANWLCHPGRDDDACDIDLTATQIDADGSTVILPFEPATDPGFDCFYIYPTVSFDPTPNSDMTPGPEELNVAANQFARYGQACRLYAPMYRQITLGELRKLMVAGSSEADLEMRYSDIKDSWDTYMREHNNGRGVVLVGHSQGAHMLFELLQNDLLAAPEWSQVIAVHAIGFTAQVDPQTGGWGNVPLCTSASDTGCMINYETFRADAEPPAASRFGQAAQDGHAICVNPAELTGSAHPQAYMKIVGLTGIAQDYGVEVSTPFVTLPGLLSAECRSNETHDWLAITVNSDPADPRADDIPGDVKVGDQVLADWGLHLVDVNLFMGDLVSLAESQGEAWMAANAE